MDSEFQPHQFHHQPPPPPTQHHHHFNNNNSTPTPPPTAPPPGMIATHQQHQFQQQNQQMQAAQNPNSSSNLSGLAFNSPAVGNSAAAVAVSVEIPEKKKRGRPRKVLAEGGNIPNAASASAEKKSRGSYSGSAKMKPHAFGADDVGFTPHLIFVRAGEDISYKVMSFVQQWPLSVCILSATGSICNVTLRQSAMSGCNVTYEGRYEILSLAGSFHPLENGSRAGALSVSLAGSDGRVVGGSVAGMLVAASPIQVIVGSFSSEIKKQKAKLPSTAPSSNILNFSAPASGVVSSPSQGENRDTKLDHGQRPYVNAGQPMHNMSMYSSMSWTNPNKMPPN